MVGDGVGDGVRLGVGLEVGLEFDLARGEKHAVPPQEFESVSFSGGSAS